MKLRKTHLLMVLPLLIFAIFGFQQNKHRHRQCTINERISRNTDLPTGYNSLFAGSGECSSCHDGLTDSQGNPVGIAAHWRSTMMANASKDPLWKAKVSHETIANPNLQAVIEDKCTSCHAPGTHFDAHHNGAANYSMAELDTSAIGLDGVNCTVCHQIAASSLGTYSGNLTIGTQHQIWGPYANPFSGPMANNTGYTPTHSAHINSSKLCASCHTLITHSVDSTGTPTGNSFVEQAIYQEWLNSNHPGTGTTCQSCHVPQITNPVITSTMPPWFSDTRSPFGLHHFVGANVFIQKLLNENSSSLGLTATTSQMDSTMNRTTTLLQNSVYMEVSEIDRTTDSLFVNVNLSNLAGHKFPSGFPSRRAFVELFVIAQANNDTIFHSGKQDSNFNLIGEDTGFEPHHNVISSDDQIQIYEMVMADVNGNPTTVLLYADSPLKDNRLVPNGFLQSHPSYDTIKVVGLANTDPNFNIDNGTEGSGGDIVHFHIPMQGYSDNVQIIAKLKYQTVNDKWLSETFSHSSAPIDSFKNMYHGSDKTPIVVAETSLTSVSVGINNKEPNHGIVVFPNPATDFISVQCSNYIEMISWFNSHGQLVHQEKYMYREGNNIPVPKTERGLFYIEIKTSQANYLKKVLLW